jgi:ferrochelatase
MERPVSRPPQVGILLLQLGAPDEAPPPRRYLRQFPSDPRVIDLPRALWWPILNLAVLPRRPARSAALYRKVWTKEGSPLLVLTRSQASGVARGLRVSAGSTISVAVAMRYGNPSTEAAVAQLLGAGCDRLLAFPMYPQYASATTGSSLEELFAALGQRRVIPAVRIVPPYYDDAAYIEALALPSGTC